ARAMGQIRSEAKTSVPALTDALKGDTRESAARALGRFGPAAKSAVPALLPALNDGDEYLRMTVIESLVGIDPEGEQTQSALIAGLKDKDDMVRGTTANLCAGLGPKARAAVPTLTAMIKGEKDQNVRSLAVDALKKGGPRRGQKAGPPVSDPPADVTHSPSGDAQVRRRVPCFRGPFRAAR